VRGFIRFSQHVCMLLHINFNENVGNVEGGVVGDFSDPERDIPNGHTKFRNSVSVSALSFRVVEACTTLGAAERAVVSRFPRFPRPSEC